VTILLEANQTQFSQALMSAAALCRSSWSLHFKMECAEAWFGDGNFLFSSASDEVPLKSFAAPIRVTELGRRDATAFAHKPRLFNTPFSFILLSHNSLAHLLTALNCPLWGRLAMG
jgi:hypothetical protein